VQSNDLRLRNTVAIFLAVVAVIYGAGEIAALF
jgi:hypothetical protein